MASFVINITGAGPHHNGKPDDIEQLAVEFVRQLQQCGHVVIDASVHVGGRVDLLSPDKIKTLPGTGD